MKKDYVWMEITSDAYELPVIIASSAQELADKAGATLNAVMSGASRYRTRTRKDGTPVKSRFIKIYLD